MTQEESPRHLEEEEDSCHLSREEAIIRLQAQARRMNAYKKVSRRRKIAQRKRNREKKEHEAATKIQSVSRMRHAKLRTDTLYAEKVKRRSKNKPRPVPGLQMGSRIGGGMSSRDSPRVKHPNVDPDGEIKAYDRWKREQIHEIHVRLPRFPREDPKLSSTSTKREVTVRDEMRLITDGLHRMDKDNLYRLKTSTEAWVKNNDLGIWMPKNPTKTRQEAWMGELTKAGVIKDLYSSGFTQAQIEMLNEAGSFERIGLAPVAKDVKHDANQLSSIWKETCGGSLGT